MSQQPDKLFHDKLANLHRPAPAGAWLKIDASVNKKKDKKIFLRIAAGVALLITASYLIWTTTKTSEQSDNPISDGSAVMQPEQTLAQRSSTAASEEVQRPVAQIQKPEVKQEQENLKGQRKTINQNGKTAGNPTAKEITVTEETLQPEDIETLIAEVEPKHEETPAIEKGNSNDGNYKLVIQSDYVNENYLDKKSVAQATEEEEKSSRLMKLLNKAYDLKSNQNALGELRQKKNEILALNLQKDKKNNKTRN